MDKYYGNVCELDIIFNFQKAYFILDELLLAGEMQESSKKNVLRCISQQDSLEDMEVRLVFLLRQAETNDEAFYLEDAFLWESRLSPPLYPSARCCSSTYVLQLTMYAVGIRLRMRALRKLCDGLLQGILGFLHISSLSTLLDGIIVQVLYVIHKMLMIS